MDGRTWLLSGLIIDQVLVAVLATIVLAVLALGPKLLTWSAKKYREARISKYLSAVSFSEREIIDALTGYITPKCCSTDPASKDELRDALSYERTSLVDFVDEFIEAGSTKYLFILADCGMGKTSFLLNYFHRNRTRLLPGKVGDMQLITLSRPDAKTEIDSVPLGKRGKIILLLDALDEDPFVFGNVDSRLRDIFEATDDFRAVVITCRSQFFSSDDAVPALSGVPRSGATRLGESKEYSVSRTYIAPFGDRDISKYLRVRIPGLFARRKRAAARRLVAQVPYLAVRPMLLSHITEVMAEQLSLTSQSDIYQAIVSAWVKREDRWVKPKPLLDYSKLLAFDLYQNRERRGLEACAKEEIEHLAAKWGIEIKTEYLTGRSLLNRYADGNYKFAHRSILEYFVAQNILTAPAGLILNVTDQIATFLLESLGCSDGSTEYYLSRAQSLRVEIVSPEIRAGMGTNYPLYRRSTQIVSPNRIHTVGCLPPRAGYCVWGDYVQTAIEYANTSSSPEEIRLHVPVALAGQYVSASMSIWFGDMVVVGQLMVSSDDLLAVCELSREHKGEIVLSSSGGLLAERRSWFLSYRCDVASSRFINVQTLEKNACVGIERDTQSRQVVISLIAGAHGPSALAEFGIVSGGSSYLLDKQTFVVIRSPTRVPLDIGREIKGVEATTPAFERWHAPQR